MAALTLGLRRLPNPETRFVLGIDRPLYLSVHSAVARLAPEGSALVHVGKYLSAQDSDSAADRIEIEALLDLAQPGWRAELAHAQYLPCITVAGRLDLASEGGCAARPELEMPGLPGLFLAGDWVKGGGWLADASLASARRSSLVIGARFDVQKAVA